MAFRITTTAFSPGGSIPVNFTRDGQNKSPLVRWEDVPEGTQSLALIVEDPDAPGATFFHWLVYDIPASVTQLDPEFPRDEQLENGIKQGLNDFGETGYDGPEPPSGRHQYIFRLYALSQGPGLKPGLNKDELLRELDSRGVLARTEISGFYKSLVKKKKAVA